MTGQITNSDYPDNSAASDHQDTRDLSRDWLNDPIFEAINGAFQLGWSIIELKSRIQIAALNASLIYSQQAKSTKESSNTSQVQRDQISENAWLMSLWRSIFNRIVECHKGCFPNGSTTEGTLYNLPDPPVSFQQGNNQAPDTNQQVNDASQTYPPYLYLYPTNDQDYANVGIKLDNTLSGFRLYDVTRRAMNCLMLLYTNSAESLIPLTVTDFQEQLIQNVERFSWLDQNNTTPPEQPHANLAALPFDQQISSAIQILSKNAIRFLETWDIYARETLYVSGGEHAQANEIQLVAYEAGRAMSSLSWGITTTLVPIENALNQTLNTDPTTNQYAQNTPVLKDFLEEAWLKVFDNASIASIQQQISALSTALDKTYIRIETQVFRPKTNDLSEPSNTDLPSKTVQAVTFSLDYWKRAVQMICYRQPTGSAAPVGASKPEIIPDMTPRSSRHLRLALVKQAQIWQSLLLFRQSLRYLTVEDVTQRIANDFYSELVMATKNDLFTPVERKFRNRFIMIAALVGLIIVLLVFYELNPGLGPKILTPFNGLLTLVTAIVTLIALVIGIVRSQGTESNQKEGSIREKKSTRLIDLNSLPEFSNTLQKGREQIRNEFGYLDQSVSVASPLVEFFILHSYALAENKAINVQTDTFNRKSAMQSLTGDFTSDSQVPITDAFDFLTQVVWTNQEKADLIGRVARAAYGPVGILVGSQINLSSNSTPTFRKRK